MNCGADTAFQCMLLKIIITGPRGACVNIRLSVVFLPVFVSSQIGAIAAVECAHGDLSHLQKAVYVSPQGNDVAGCGQSTASACKTIQQGIANCSGESCGVLVRYGVYNTAKPINVADGVSVFG